MSRLCCRARRTAGAPDFTETALIPAMRRPDESELAADAPPARASTGASTTSPLSADQLDLLPAGALERALEHFHGNVPSVQIPDTRAPVPRRPWRRVWCWAAGGHFYFPDVAACLDCGKERGRASWRGDR